MKPICLLCSLIPIAFAQDPLPRPRAGAAATGRGDTLAWIASGIRQAKGTLPGDPIDDAKKVWGTWSVGGGSGSRSHGMADFNSDTAGIGLQFGEDGKYRVRYGATLIMGAFVSATKVDETGQWSVKNGRLMLEPAAVDGWISVMSGKKEPVRQTQKTPRSFEISEIGEAIVIRGRCFEYQVDPYCGSKSDGYRTLDFPLHRVR